MLVVIVFGFTLHQILFAIAFNTGVLMKSLCLVLCFGTISGLTLFVTHSQIAWLCISADATGIV